MSDFIYLAPLVTRRHHGQPGIGTRPPWSIATTRAGFEGPRSFHNNGAGPYKGRLLVEAPTSAFIFKTLLYYDPVLFKMDIR